MRAAPWLRLRPSPAARWTSAPLATGGCSAPLAERLTPTALARAAQAVLGAPGGPWLTTLLRRVQTGRYRPGPVRHRSRPKADGTTRTLSIPHPVDRVLQRAVLDLMGPDLDRLLLPGVHGFRPGRSPQTAVRALLATPAAPHLELVQAEDRKSVV